MVHKLVLLTCLDHPTSEKHKMKKHDDLGSDMAVFIHKIQLWHTFGIFFFIILVYLCGPDVLRRGGCNKIEDNS